MNPNDPLNPNPMPDQTGQPQPVAMPAPNEGIINPTTPQPQTIQPVQQQMAPPTPLVEPLPQAAQPIQPVQPAQAAPAQYQQQAPVLPTPEQYNPAPVQAYAVPAVPAPQPQMATAGSTSMLSKIKIPLIIGIILVVLVGIVFGFFRLQSNNSSSILRSFYEVYSDQSEASTNTNDALYAALYYSSASEDNYKSKAQLATDSINSAKESTTSFSELSTGRWPVRSDVKDAAIGFSNSTGASTELMEKYLEDASAGVAISVGFKELQELDRTSPIRVYSDPKSTVAARAASQREKASELRKKISDTTFKTEEVKAVFEVYDQILKGWVENRAAVEKAINKGDEAGASKAVSNSYTLLNYELINEKIEAIRITLKASVENKDFTTIDKLYQDSIQK